MVAPGEATQLVVKKFQPEAGSAYWRTLIPLQNEREREVLISLPGGFTVERWKLSEAEKREVANRPHIEAVIEEGYGEKPQPPEATRQSVSMNLQDAVTWHQVDVLHRAGLKGRGQIIAVLDTGISKALAEELGDRLIGAVSFVDGEDAYDEGAESGHGTFCAEAAATFAPEAKILSIKVLSSREGWGKTSWIIKGYNHARQNAATVATASLGGPGEPTDAMCQTLDALSRDGVLCVSAAGNEQRSSTAYKADESHPACAAESTTVAAFDSDKELAPFSNWGMCVRLGALGVKVFQSGRDWNGTSMATPMVAGIAACVRAAKTPQLTVAEVKKILYAGADDTEYDVWKEGYGLTNGDRIADYFGVGNPYPGYHPDLPRVSYTKFVAGDDKRQAVLTKRRNERGVFFPKVEVENG